ncbi:hypothetical protein FXO38_07209 [Capsicum annuum]|nr:hypothetical protein FXO38_07209 [Capsicum annuum]KAF3673605.1 hypothetical protein FXO37_06889 [Capsicum annuum]
MVACNWPSPPFQWIWAASQNIWAYGRQIWANLHSKFWSPSSFGGERLEDSPRLLTTNDKALASRPKALAVELLGYNYALRAHTGEK